jgi:hypothetical protein
MMKRQDLFKKKVEEVLISKVEEFHMLGYEAVTTEDIWKCVNTRYKGGWPRLHKLVNDIYKLKATDLMNWLTIGAYQGKIDLEKNDLV